MFLQPVVYMFTQSDSNDDSLYSLLYMFLQLLQPIVYLFTKSDSNDDSLLYKFLQL